MSISLGSTYTPWGVCTASPVDDPNRDYSFTGKPKDISGLVYFNARYYDPGLGRFVTEDPVKDGENWYSFCGSNPLTFTDPTGLRSCAGENDTDSSEERAIAAEKDKEATIHEFQEKGWEDLDGME